MIQSHYPDVDVFQIKDHKLDSIWYQELDRRIREIEPHAEITLYGGRDSFADYYDGAFPVEVLTDIENSFSGTEIRERVGNTPLSTPDFRAGVIYAIANRFPLTHLTVDIGLINPYHSSPTKNSRILLGRKEGDRQWCFPGGFVDAKDASLEDATRRELFEETGCHTSSVQMCKYVASLEVVNDWRYKNEVDRIMTNVFLMELPPNSPYLKNNDQGEEGTGLLSENKLKASDDLAEIQWFDLKEFSETPHHFVTNDLITKAHQPIMQVFIAHLKDNELYGLANDKPKPQDCD